MFNVPYLFNYADRQDLSVKQSRYIAKTYYNGGASGLPGNSDAGAMQTWLLWNMIGLYPITGQTTFLIHSPWFESMTIDLGGGKTLRIGSTGGDGNGDNNIYVQSLQVNGQPWTKNWLTWNDVFAHGGTLDFVLGSQPKNWTSGEVPPSPASE
jgi:putative alpha-1,2-mannosidase